MAFLADNREDYTTGGSGMSVNYWVTLFFLSLRIQSHTKTRNSKPIVMRYQRMYSCILFDFSGDSSLLKECHDITPKIPTTPPPATSITLLGEVMTWYIVYPYKQTAIVAYCIHSGAKSSESISTVFSFCYRGPTAVVASVRLYWFRAVVELQIPSSISPTRGPSERLGHRRNDTVG